MVKTLWPFGIEVNQCSQTLYQKLISKNIFEQTVLSSIALLLERPRGYAWGKKSTSQLFWFSSYMSSLSQFEKESKMQLVTFLYQYSLLNCLAFEVFSTVAFHFLCDVVIFLRTLFPFCSKFSSSSWKQRFKTPNYLMFTNEKCVTLLTHFSDSL